MLWTNPGEIVLSPFMGIGSEGYVALRWGAPFRWRRTEGELSSSRRWRI